MTLLNIVLRNMECDDTSLAISPLLPRKCGFGYASGMKKLVLAEKPSVARELARVLGCTIREKGYLEGTDYIVTWALGHLVELAPPADYNENWKRWSIGSLPMLPEPLKQVVIEESRDQFDVVKGLMNRDDVSSLVIATDAGREGELVARWIMVKSGWKKDAERLWISSQTDSAIKEGFANLKPASLYDNLYHAAESRAAADWYVGMNVTRALTCHYDAKLSAGRVQTPTLALMTEREDERDKFIGSFYWTLKADFGTFTGTWTDSEGNTHIGKEETVKALETLLPGKEGSVASVDTTDMVDQPPLAYDLTELQRDANIYLDFSAKMTLDTLQKLYEIHKIVTYPRTDSRYITHDIVATLPDRLKALSGTPFGPLATKYVAEGYRVDEDRFVKDMAVTDHHAIIPTEQKVDLTRLNKDEKALWTLIATRFLEVLSPDYTYKTTVLKANVEDSLFQARLTTPVQQGWRDVARISGRRDDLAMMDDYEGGLASLKSGDKVKVSSVKSRRFSTPAPDRYTDATLLSAMEHAGRFVDDADLKKHLGGGLGTPATRADLIEKLVQYHYVDRVGKEFVPTPKGREVVRLAPLQLRAPELTGKWEERLSAIAEGTEDALSFVTDIKKNARDLVEQVVATRDSYHPAFTDSKECPYCHGPMMKVVDELGQVHYVCQKLSCSYEEMIVKKRIKVEKPKDEKPVVKKVVVRKVPVSASASPTGMKRIVLKKKPMASFSLPDDADTSPSYTYKYEEETVVVRPSKKDWHRDDKRVVEHRDFHDPHIAREKDSLGGGGTFADFIKASQDRKNRDKKKK